MTNDELKLSAAEAFKSLPERFEIISAKVVTVDGIENGAGSATTLAWLRFKDSSDEPRELIFKLGSEDPQWVQNQIVQQLRSNAASIRNEIRADSVSGLLVGTNTGIINRNFFGGDTYNHIQFFALSASGRRSGMVNLNGNATEPYKSLAPYGALDSRIFKGRENEITQLHLYIQERRIVVLTGEASVGKTSLLTAGVIPRLLDDGVMAIKIQEYANPLETIVQALKAQQKDLAIPLGETSSLSHVIQAITGGLGGTLVLVLDQFELLFEGSINPEQRKRFIDELASCLRNTQSEFFRLVIAIRDEATTHLWKLQDRIPELLRTQVDLLPLSRTQAARAIREPLKELKSQVTFHGDVVERVLVPSLGELGSGDPNFVHPPYLQIVCSWLYHKSTRTDPPTVIDDQMVGAKGAHGIFATYLEETLKRIEDESRLFSRVLSLMARPETEKWVTPAQLHEMNQAVSLIDVERTLQTLVRAGLLVRRAVDDRFAFVNPIIAQEILRLAGPEVERRSRAENEVERVWLSWLARDAFASSEQLRYLETFGNDLAPRAVKSMLLLRSAVERHEPTSPWLDLLNGTEGRNLMIQLESLPLPSNTPIASGIALTTAEELLDLPVDANGNTDTPRYTHGRVAQNAVSHRNAAVRQTCALALTAISNNKKAGLDRLSSALSGNRTQLKLRAELRGTLADANPEFEDLNRSVSRTERVAIWAWRALRRIAQDRSRCFTLMIGGAVGSGLALGAMRGLIAAFGQAQPGIQFTMYFFYGFILDGALALGMSLARPLLLIKRPQRDPAGRFIGSFLKSLSTSLAVILGAIFFGVAHILVTVGNGLSPLAEPLILIMGFVGGLGLSLSIFLLHRIRSRFVAWPLTILCAITVWTIIQLVFNLTEAPADAISIVNTGWFYEGVFENHSWWQQLATNFTNLPELIAVVDSALAGAFLAVGTAIGLSWANKQVNRRLRERASTLE